MHAERLGRYELIQHLASGGMASVYLARVSGPGGFQRHVVLKTLPASHVTDEVYVAMFLDEARLIATLHHHHVAQVFEVGRAEDGTYFLAMEYVHGETVRSVLETAHKRRYALPREFGLTVVCAAASGLHHAHERRGLDGTPLHIVHRDVSPSNVIAGFDGAVKLIDFGIARADARSTRTRTGLIKGKAGYMAPEQALGYEVDRRSDVFALGILAYELTTQVRAFHASSRFEAMKRTAHVELVPPTKVIPGYPPMLEDVIMTALELDPDDRFQDAEAMRRALAQTATELGHVLGPAAVTGVLDDLFGTPVEPWLAPPRPSDQNISVDPDVITPVLEFTAPKPRAIALARGTRELDAAGPGARAETVPLSPPRARAPEAIPPPPPRARELDELPTRRFERSESAPPPAAPAPFSLARSLQPPARSWRVPAIAAAAVAIGAVVAIQLASGPGSRAPADAPLPAPPPPRAPAAPPPPRPAPPPATPAPVPDTVTLRVTSDPVGATVVLDGVRLGTTPFTAAVHRAPRPAWLKVRMSHYIAIKKRVSLEHDVEWDVHLRLLSRYPTPAAH